MTRRGSDFSKMVASPVYIGRRKEPVRAFDRDLILNARLHENVHLLRGKSKSA